MCFSKENILKVFKKSVFKIHMWYRIVEGTKVGLFTKGLILPKKYFDIFYILFHGIIVKILSKVKNFMSII